jgi:long-chain acyl-CoA synthetase
MYTTVPQMFRSIAMAYPSFSVQLSKDANGVFCPTTYSQLLSDVHALAAALSEQGVRRGDLVGLVSDNRSEWLLSDLAILALGAADVPRGRDAMPYELEFILSATEASFCFVENIVQLRKVMKLKEKLPHLARLVVMDRSVSEERVVEEQIGAGVEILLLGNLLARGHRLLDDPRWVREIDRAEEAGRESDVATVIFTSGTTGDPKGVVLTHRNFLFQLEQLPRTIVKLAPGQRWLSVLPVWHSFERILQYVIVSQASAIAYSKPLGSVLLADLQKVNPHWMGSVPRIWEAVKTGVYQSMKKKGPMARHLFSFFVAVAGAYDASLDLLLGTKASFSRRSRVLDVARSIVPLAFLAPLHALGDRMVYAKIREKLGNQFLAGVSGGGSLGEGVDRFFSAIGIKLLDGYGLTEAAPVVALRHYDRSVKRTVSPLGNTETKIVDEQGNAVGPGHKGVLMVRGEQVMKGYYKRPDLTAQVLSPDGWLDTGDLAVWTHDGQFSIVGRAKDTIVLAGGENLEPVPIEAKLCECEMIEQAVVVGQDKKYLGALLVLDLKLVEQYLQEHQIPYLADGIAKMKEVNELIAARIGEIVSTKQGFKSFEQINRFAIIAKPFEIGKELSAKQELKRFEINRLYKNEIEELFAS